MDLADVIAHAERLGDIVYVATASPAGNPHVVPLSCGWLDERLYANISRRGPTYRNAAANPIVCAHLAVTEDEDWDSLIVWGVARLLDSVSDKRRLWAGVLPYDLSAFDPGGPDDSPNGVFLEVTPTRALLLRHYGEKGRDEWHAEGSS